MNNYSCYTNGDVRSIENRYINLRDKNNRPINQREFIAIDRWKDNLTEPLVNHKAYEGYLQEKDRLFKSNNIRVFISHKKEDSVIATELAKDLDQMGINYWLDVLNPEINQTNDEIIISNIIELALLNCNYVVAIMTDNSYKSTWIPYEYGRVKEKRIHVKSAIAMKHNLTKSLPGYMKLGKIAENKMELINDFKKIKNQISSRKLNPTPYTRY